MICPHLQGRLSVSLSLSYSKTRRNQIQSPGVICPHPQKTMVCLPLPYNKTRRNQIWSHGVICPHLQKRLSLSLSYIKLKREEIQFRVMV